MGMSERQQARFKAMLEEKAEERARANPVVPINEVSAEFRARLAEAKLMFPEPESIFGYTLEDWCRAYESDRKEAEKRIAADRARRRSNVLKSGVKITDDLEKTVLDKSWDETAALTKVREWHEDASAKPWLVLSGTVGRGKTVAAVAAISFVSDSVFIRAREMSRAFTARFGEDQELQQRCFNAPLLVIDDIGRESDHAAMCAYLEDLLDERPSRRYRTILTTNLDRAQFLAAYPDERLRSRLAQLADFFADKGDDMRRGGK